MIKLGKLPFGSFLHKEKIYNIVLLYNYTINNKGDTYGDNREFKKTGNK